MACCPKRLNFFFCSPLQGFSRAESGEFCEPSSRFPSNFQAPRFSSKLPGSVPGSCKTARLMS
ncbi:hypothetical protein KC19_10G169200 [Ceratodon purpureus]|uniref:Uncharacterized protein n=1 Tax=Ceratodon purpureus TaxID=3225 RepID=A0A8T0GL86_CERPU|nr:hypothetical protein KC19_10G169200 [Ceratodon purpureus]